MRGQHVSLRHSTHVHVKGPEKNIEVSMKEVEIINKEWTERHFKNCELAQAR